MAAPYRTWVEISQSRLAANLRVVADLVGPGVELCPVVKANAYGHGAVPVARALAAEGARWLAVSCVEEGVALRDAGIGSIAILTMADFLPSSREAIVRYRLTPVIHDLDELPVLEALAARHDTHIDFHLALDTGMGRLGTRAEAEQIAPALAGLSRARLTGVMTHLASAADPASGQTSEQAAHFNRVCAGLPVQPRYRHVAATGALAAGRRETWNNFVRPGLAIYGYATAGGRLAGLQPALTWKAALLAVKDVPAGAPVGYGATFRTSRPTRLGIVGAGYADGVPPALANRGCFWAGDAQAPILGAVSMDVTTVDLTAAPLMRPGDMVTLIAGEPGKDAAAMAQAAGMIPYAVLCGIGPRVRRIWLD